MAPQIRLHRNLRRHRTLGGRVFVPYFYTNELPKLDLQQNSIAPIFPPQARPYTPPLYSKSPSSYRQRRSALRVLPQRYDRRGPRINSTPGATQIGETVRANRRTGCYVLSLRTVWDFRREIFSLKYLSGGVPSTFLNTWMKKLGLGNASAADASLTDMPPAMRRKPA